MTSKWEPGERKRAGGDSVDVDVRRTMTTIGTLSPSASSKQAFRRFYEEAKMRQGDFKRDWLDVPHSETSSPNE